MSGPDLTSTADLPASRRAARPPWQRNVAWLAPIFLGAVLLFSAWTKILAPRAFVATIEAYGIVPAQYSLLVATGVVALEFALGAMLLTGILRRMAAWLTLPLLVFFLVLVIYATRVGLESCGCFGEVIKIPPAVEILVDSTLLVLLGLVLWLSPSWNLVPRSFRQAFAWTFLCLGAGLFLARNPGSGEGETLAVDPADLTVLELAEPPVALPSDGFLFFFSADCDHCWAFTPGVEAMHRRLQDFRVLGVTYSDPQALQEFRRAFAPTFPIHVLPESSFSELIQEYPAGIWLEAGAIARTWSGFIPSYRELSQLGGYPMLEGPLLPEREAPKEAAVAEPDSAGLESLFGGPVRARHD